MISVLFSVAVLTSIFIYGLMYGYWIHTTDVPMWSSGVDIIEQTWDGTGKCVVVFCCGTVWLPFIPTPYHMLFQLVQLLQLHIWSFLGSFLLYRSRYHCEYLKLWAKHRVYFWWLRLCTITDQLHCRLQIYCTNFTGLMLPGPLYCSTRACHNNQKNSDFQWFPIDKWNHLSLLTNIGLLTEYSVI